VNSRSLSAVVMTVGILFVAALVQRHSIQRRSLPTNFEQLARSAAVIVGISVVPVLIVLSYRAWADKFSDGDPRWQRWVGLASIVIPGISWTLLFAQWILATMSWPGSGFLDLGSRAALGYANMLALLLAVPLRGIARINIIVSVVLIWIWIRLLVQV
jgi:hypothetical protein